MSTAEVAVKFVNAEEEKCMHNVFIFANKAWTRTDKSATP
jgi:hypothetical protein